METNLIKNTSIFQGAQEIDKGGVWSRIKRSFKEPLPSNKKIEDPQIIKKKYTLYTISIFISIYIIYFVSYLVRKNYNAAMPSMEKALHLTNTDLGILGAVYYATYCVGKFTNGVLADKSNVRVFLPISIILSGIANIGMAVSAIFIPTPSSEIMFLGMSSKTVMLLLMATSWGLNGWFQSAAFPLCGKTLTFWFSNKERPSVWSWWSTSHEIGGSVGILFATAIMEVFNKDWKAAFIVPALLAIVVGVIGFISLRDKPVTVGLPEVEEYKHTKEELHEEVVCEEDKNMSYWQMLKKYIITNKKMWFLASTLFCVYILRFGPLDWFVKYFKDHGDSSYIAALKACILPAFGVLGTLSIPFVSKRLFQGRRAPATFLYMFLASICLFIMSYFIFNEKQGNVVLDFTLLGLLGICTNGPLVLVGGISCVELCSKKVAAAATGFTGFFGYLGAIAVSYGTGWLIDGFGYSHAVMFWGIAALLGALLCIPLWKVKSNPKT